MLSPAAAFNPSTAFGSFGVHKPMFASLRRTGFKSWEIVGRHVSSTRMRHYMSMSSHQLVHPQNSSNSLNINSQAKVVPRRSLFDLMLAYATGLSVVSQSVQPASAQSATKKTLRLYTGSLMPMTGLGTWESPKGEVYGAVQAALNAGSRHLDCAAIYFNEKEVGEALSDWLAKSGVPRSQVWVTSKLWNDRRRPADVREALEQTLADLRVSYLDLYLIHWPVVWARNSLMKPDAGASLREAWQTLEQLVDEGKVKNIGVSNYNENELGELLNYARIKPAVNQIELHPRLPQDSLVSYCQRNGIVVTGYCPLGRGNVKGAGLLDDPLVKSIAATHAVSPASVLLRWNLQRDVIVIPKTVSPARAAQNENEPWTFSLSEEEMTRLGQLADGARFLTAPWSTFADKSPQDIAAARAIGAVNAIFR